MCVELSYPVKLESDEEGFILVTFPDVPEALTQGESLDEAIRVAKDALESALEFYSDDGRPYPTPSKPEPGQHVVTVSVDD